MEITLVNTREALDVSRRLPDGTVEFVGSFEVSVSDPGFVRDATRLVERIRADEGVIRREDYERTAEECTSLVRRCLPSPEAADALLGDRLDLYNSMLLLTAIIGIVNRIDPDAQVTEQIGRLVPDAGILSAEMAAGR